MKLRKLAVAGVLLAGMAYAGAENRDLGSYRDGGFMGVRGSYVFSLESSILGLPGGGYFDESYKGSGPSFGLYLGGQEGAWRALLSYDHFKKDDQKYDLFMAEVDYLFLENSGMIQPYLGINGGWLGYETPNAADTDGFAYGGSFGVVFKAGDNVDIDLGTHYLFATQDEVDHIGSVSLGISYFY